MKASCMDCGIDYDTEIPIDTVMPIDQWLLINPSDAGILCANCIVKRCAKLKDILYCSINIVFKK